MPLDTPDGQIRCIVPYRPSFGSERSTDNIRYPPAISSLRCPPSISKQAILSKTASATAWHCTSTHPEFTLITKKGSSIVKFNLIIKASFSGEESLRPLSTKCTGSVQLAESRVSRAAQSSVVSQPADPHVPGSRSRSNHQQIDP